MKLTRKRAKEFSLLHWREKVKNNGRPLSDEKLKELGIYDFHNHCGYCGKYYYATSKILDWCARCPIRPKVKDYDDLSGSGCQQRCHPFYKWLFHRTSENARGVLTLIEQS